MKRIISIMCMLAIIISLCGCGAAKNKNGIVQISAAESFLVALKGDGTVVATGPNSQGTVVTTETDSDEFKIKDWKNVKKVVADFDTLTLRGSIVAALHNDGTVSANYYITRIGNDKITNEYNENLNSYHNNVPKWNDIIDIATNGDYLFAINSKGEVFVQKWSVDAYFKSDYSEFKDVKSIVSGGGTSLIGLNNDGTVVGAGSSTLGQTDVSSWKNIIQVDSSTRHTVGLNSDGTLIATKFTESPDDTAMDKKMQSDYNKYGELDFKDWKDIKAISVSDNFTAGLKNNGKVVAIGDNTHGQCDVSDWRNIEAISTTLYATYGLKKDGTIVSTGKYTYQFDK